MTDPAAPPDTKSSATPSPDDTLPPEYTAPDPVPVPPPSDGTAMQALRDALPEAHETTLVQEGVAAEEKALDVPAPGVLDKLEASPVMQAIAKAIDEIVPVLDTVDSTVGPLLPASAATVLADFDKAARLLDAELAKFKL